MIFIVENNARVCKELAKDEPCMLIRDDIVTSVIQEMNLLQKFSSDSINMTFDTLGIV